MRCKQILMMCVSMLAAVSTLGAPATRPASPEEEKRELQLQSVAEASRLPVITVGSPAEAVRLSVSGNMLGVEWVPKDSPAQLKLALPNAGIVAVVTIPRLHGETGSPHGFFMLLRDFSAAGSAYAFTMVSASGGRVQLARDYSSSTVTGSTELIQDAPLMAGQEAPGINPVRLTVRRTNEVTQQDVVKLNLSAPTFVALCRTYPAETQEYLRPIFDEMGAESAVFAPDPAAVWQALADDWTPEGGLVKSVNEAIAKFDAEDFHERQSAAHALHGMGEPAALTLMHMDRSKFSAAVNSGIDTFLAPYLPLSPEEANRLGKDRNFLLDSQYSGDVALRKLAAARLAKVAGQALGFDPAAEDATRLAQVRAVRQQNAPAATAPVAR